jgi:hypothetical protein
MPSERQGLRQAAEKDLLAALEAIHLASGLMAGGQVGERERRLAAAIQLAAREAERAVRWLSR